MPGPILRKVFFSTVLLLSGIFAQAQKHTPVERPKLIVGIVVDQMRYDYLFKYYDKYTANGFRKLLKGGFNCQNTNYNYVPTYTGPGHASVYAGTTPAIHGIIGNNWFVRETGKKIYVTDDPEVKTVGSSNAKVGKMSPRNMLTTTFCDELRLFSNMRSKVVALALKDRSSILPGGHLSNGSYWFDSESGNFVTSTFYTEKLPAWVDSFNARRLPEKYLSKPWETLLPIQQYRESAPDNNPYEELFPGESTPVFPHMVNTMYKPNDYEVIRYTPYGNNLTKEFALAAIEGENLGKGPFTDVLAISFSSPDYIGHMMGPQSIEVQDNYLRLDLDIAEIISALEKKYGKNGFLLFLTADHAAAQVPAYMADLKVPAGYFEGDAFKDSLKTYLSNKYGRDDLLHFFINEQVYLRRDVVSQNNIDLNALQEDVARFSLGFKGVVSAYTARQMQGATFSHKPGSLVQMGFYPKRSGDVALMLEPGWMDYGHTGTTHGSAYSYDTQVPLLWYGWKIPTGSTGTPINITDIAPTVSALLQIAFPNGCTGYPIPEIVNGKNKK